MEHSIIKEFYGAKRKIVYRKRIIIGVIVLALLVGAIFASVYTYKVISIQKAEEKAIAELTVALELAKAEKADIKTPIPKYALTDIFNMDLSKPSGVTKKQLKQVMRGGIVGLEDTFLEAEKKYKVNAVFLAALTGVESGWGSINFRSNNMFGYGKKGYATKEDCIMDVAKGLGTRYLTPGGGLYYGKTIRAVHTKYASSSTWDDKVAKNMLLLYTEIREDYLVEYKAKKLKVNDKIKALREELEQYRRD